jgi:hypothetical protein
MLLSWKTDVSREEFAITIDCDNVNNLMKTTRGKNCIALVTTSVYKMEHIFLTDDFEADIYQNKIGWSLSICGRVTNKFVMK